MASRSASGESPRGGSRRGPGTEGPDERFAGDGSPAGNGSPAGDLDEALSRARRHARSAVAEAFEALRALLDAASLATSGASAGLHPLFAQADAWLRSGAHRLAGEGGLPGDLAASLAEALGAEIARWEERARVDPDARAVLRAFLGLRELLWELGVRPAASPTHGAGRSERSASPPAAETAPRRVERVAVEG